MILLTFRHGLRAAEVCDLRWEQVDFKAATLHVRRLKNGTPRSLLIGLRASGRIRLGAKCVNMAKEIERAMPGGHSPKAPRTGRATSTAPRSALFGFEPRMHKPSLP
jgi:integrase